MGQTLRFDKAHINTLNITEDDRTIFFLYLYYCLRIEKIQTSSSRDFVQKSKSLMDLEKYGFVNECLELSGNHQMVDSMYDELVPFFRTRKEEELKTDLIKYIEEYLSRFHSIDLNVEELDKAFLSNNMGDLLVITPYVKKYLYDGSSIISSLCYEFYDDLINTMAGMAFEINGVSSKRFDYESARIEDETYFDTIIYTPPYHDIRLLSSEARNERAMDSSSASFESKVLRTLNKKRKENGRLLSTVMTGALSKRTDIAFKKYLCENSKIRYVVELPRLELIKESLTMFLITDEAEELTITNATKFAQNIRRGINLDSDKIIRAISKQIDGAWANPSVEYLRDNDYDFTPHRYFDMAKDRTDYNSKPLGELIDKIFRGYQISSSMLDEYVSETNTRIKLITLSDIEDGTVDESKAQCLKGIDKAMEHYIIRKGDFVISCKGKTFKTAVIDVPYNETYISTGTIIVIRCKEGVLDPVYLKMFFDSELGREELRRTQSGTKVMSLNPPQMKNILIPLPSFDKQNELACRYNKGLRDIRDLRDSLETYMEGFDRKFNKNFIKLLD